MCSSVASLSSPATLFAPSVSATISFSMASLLVPPPSSVLPSAPFSSLAPLASSQPVGTSVSVSLGSGGVTGGVFPGATAVLAANATPGCRLPDSVQAGIDSDLLNFPEGEVSDTRLCSEATIAFLKVLSFIASFFPNVLPSESQPPHFTSWFQGFGKERRKEPLVYLSNLCRMGKFMVAIVRKVTSNAKDQRRSYSVLPKWGDTSRLLDIPSSHAAIPPDPQFSRFLNRSVPSSKYVSLSLEDCTRLESCLRWLVSSLSFASWAIVLYFAFLCYAGMSPSGDEFNNVGFSLSVALSVQAKTSYAVSIFLRHVLRKTYVAYLPPHTHDSVKHALLSTPSVECLFPRRSFSVRWGKLGGFSLLKLLRTSSS